MKKFIILLFTCTLVLTLASCSGNSTENANTSSPSSAPVEENHGSPTTSTTVGKLSEVLEEKKVWLLVDNFQWVLDKDSEAVAIVFDEGKVYISPADYTLGEFSKMTDEEILAYTKSNDTHNSDSEELIKKVEESDVFNGRHTVTNTVPLFGSPEADGIIEWFMPKYLEGEYGSPMISKSDYDALHDEDKPYYFIQAMMESNANIDLTTSINMSGAKNAVIESLKSENAGLAIGVYTDGSGNRVVKEELKFTQEVSSIRWLIEEIAKIDQNIFEDNWRYRIQEKILSMHDVYVDVYTESPQYVNEELKNVGYVQEVTFDNGTTTESITYTINENEGIPLENGRNRRLTVAGPLDGDAGTRTVYDSIYQGYYCLDDDKNRALITRVEDGDIMFMLDDLDSENVEIDPKDW